MDDIFFDIEYSLIRTKTIFAYFFNLFKYIFLCLSNVINNLKSDFLKINSKNTKNQHLTNFLTFIFWIYWLSLFLYIGLLIKKIVNNLENFFKNSFNKESIKYIHNIKNKKSNIEFRYFSSTLLNLINSHKYNLFII